MRQLAFVCNMPVLGGGSQPRPRHSVHTDVRQRQYSRSVTRSSSTGSDPGAARTTSGFPPNPEHQCTGPCATTAGDPQSGHLPAAAAAVDQQRGAELASAIPRGAPYAGSTGELRAVPGADGDWYLGQRNPSVGGRSTVLDRSRRDGLTFSYYDSIGTVTTDSFKVAQIQIVLRAARRRPSAARTACRRTRWTAS